MRVKYVRKNANGLGINDRSISLYNYIYDSHGELTDKNYGGKSRFLEAGYESNVYAMKISDNVTSFYIIEPKFNSITHFPALCFDILDDRISQYWHIERRLFPGRDGIMPQEPREVTYFAIKEWIQEPRFLEYLVDDKERELGIMNKMIKLMDAEFEE